MAYYNPSDFTPARARLRHTVARYLLKPLFQIFKRLEVTGAEGIPADGPLVVVANHVSALDPPLLAAACHRPLAYMAKRELFDSATSRPFMKFLGAFSVDRATPGPHTFKAAAELLDKGWALAMFIEGTRIRTRGRLGRPHLGTAYLADRHQAPILPVGIRGTSGLWDQARVSIGGLIEPSPDLVATTWKIMDALANLTGYELPERRIADRFRPRGP